MNAQAIRVLLIEDNPGDAGLIRRMLARTVDPPVELHHVTTFSAAMEPLRSGSVSLLLLDLGLPGSKGFETIATALSVAPAIPVVVLTGTDEAQTILECIKAGAKDYFVKSRIDPERLIQVIGRWGRRAKSDGASGKSPH